MIIKHADNKKPQLAALEGLLSHPSADAATQKRIEQEIRNVRAGIRGEEEVAYEMKVHHGESQEWMVIHDLRLEHAGLSAQIDHLLINRFLDVWVCESKHFSEGLVINEQGEFAGLFGGKPYGLPSPIEQNNRHLLILKRLLDSGAVNLPNRLGFVLKTKLHSLILVSKGAHITRPGVWVKGIETVIKNDQVFKTIEKSAEDATVFDLSKSLFRLVSAKTLEDIARQLVRLHKPIRFKWHAKFGLPDPKDDAPRTLTLRQPAKPAQPEELPKKPKGQVKSKV